MTNILKRIFRLMFKLSLFMMCPVFFIYQLEPGSVQIWDKPNIYYMAMSNWDSKSDNLVPLGVTLTKEKAIRDARHEAEKYNEAVKTEKKAKQENKKTAKLLTKLDYPVSIYYHVKSDGSRYIAVVREGYPLKDDGIYEEIKLNK